MNFKLKTISTLLVLLVSAFFIYPTSIAYAATTSSSTTSSATAVESTSGNTTTEASDSSSSDSSSSSTEAPSIIGKSAIVINYKTGQILYAKNIDTKEYPASTTKIMTSILFAENKNPDDTITYTKSASEQPANSLLVNYDLLNVGDTMQAGEVMKAMFLISANDCAYMEADSVAGNKEAFADLMNAEVKKLGLTGTHFTNPNGLFNVDNYSTAYDMSVIVRKAFSIPWIREAMGTKSALITASTGKSVTLTSDNKNLGIDGCIGGKTGYLPDHGRDLVNVYDRNGEILIGVIYNDIWGKNDTDVFNDMKKIINYAYSEKQTLYKAKGTVVENDKVSYKLFGFFGPTETINIPLTLDENVYYYAIPLNEKDFTITGDTSATNAWALLKDPTSAKVLVSDGRQYKETYDATATITLWQIIDANLAIYIITAIVAIIIILIILALIIRAINKSKRKRRKQNKK
ncbi:MAG: D-alanyl-D-alanine carboxypeptidase [Clostridium perfringens]|nr:D-alanyl-D-alanine carboxypeptidase [Clostridium perfringens]